jgi:hypothetical protein
LVESQPHNTDLYYNLAGVYCRNNQIEDSIHWLKLAVANGYNDWDRLKSDNNFDGIRQTPFFKNLMNKKST